MERETHEQTNSQSNEAVAKSLTSMTTKRESMSIENRESVIIEKIIDMKAQMNTLPITMRKLYAYKIANLEKKRREKNKIIPLVLRKRMMLEKTVGA